MASKIDFKIPEISKDDHMTTHEYVYHRLRNALMIGAIEPGVALKIRALAEYMEISPTPIREALRRLSSENALEVLENRRIVVPLMTAEKFDELILLRIKLECHAAERGLPYMSDIIIEKMSAIDEKMNTEIKNRNYDALTVLNHEFHEVLYTANTNQTVMPLIQSIWLQLGPFQRQVMDTVMNFYLVDRHVEILDALHKRDSLALTNATESDIRDGIGRAGRDVMRKILS